MTDSTAPLPQLSPFISSNLRSVRTESSWLRGSFVAVFLIFLRCEILMFHDVFYFLLVLTPTSVLAWQEKVGWVERGFTKPFKERVAAGSKDSLAFTTTLEPHSIVRPCTEMLILLCSSPFTRASFSPLLFNLLIDIYLYFIYYIYKFFLLSFHSLMYFFSKFFQGLVFSSCPVQRESESASCLTASSEASPPAEPLTACDQSCQVNTHEHGYVNNAHRIHEHDSSNEYWS